MQSLILILALTGATPVVDGIVNRILETTATEWLAVDYGIPEDDVEYRLPDGRKVDLYDRACGVAWEVEWAHKWEESIGQAIGYASVLDVDPGVVLLFKGKEDDEEWNQFQTAAEYLQGRGIPLKVKTERLRDLRERHHVHSERNQRWPTVHKSHRHRRLPPLQLQPQSAMLLTSQRTWRRGSSNSRRSVSRHSSII